MWQTSKLSVVAGAIVLSVAVAGCDLTSGREGPGQYADDAAITTKVKTAMIQDPNVTASEITVHTYNGVVQLSGFVHSKKEAELAVADARKVEGVRDVKNSIVVQ